MTILVRLTLEVTTVRIRSTSIEEGIDSNDVSKDRRNDDTDSCRFISNRSCPSYTSKSSCKNRGRPESART